MCEAIPPSEFVAWTIATGNEVRHREYAVLAAMDVAFCAAMNDAIAEHRAREAEAREEKSGGKGWFGFGRKG